MNSVDIEVLIYPAGLDPESENPIACIGNVN